MKYTLIFIIFSIILTSCDEEVLVDPFAVSDKTRDSIYTKVQELHTNQKNIEAEKLLSSIRERDIYDHTYFGLNYKVKISLKKYSEAIQYLNLASRVSQDRSPIYYLKADCYASINMMDSAIVFLNKAIDLDSLNPGYLKVRIKYYLENKLASLALNDANRLVRIDSTNLNFKTYVGLSKFEFGDTIGAINIYESIFQKDPNNLSALKSLGFIKMRQNKFAVAKKYFEKYIDIEPTNGEIFFALAQILSKEKKVDMACDCLLKSIEFGYQEAIKHAYKCEEQFKKKGVQIQIQKDSIPQINEDKNKQI